MPRSDNIVEIEPDLRGAGLKVGIVMSRFNAAIGEGLGRQMAIYQEEIGVLA